MTTIESKKGYKKRLTPLMGWASWNNYRIHINEQLLKEQVDALVATGLAEVGYNYFNIDDGFFGGRDENGRIKTHPERFPNGMKVMSDYIHSKGLKAGIYSEAGSNTCAHIYDNPEGNSDGVGVGLYGYDEQDLRMYLIEWDYDFIKIDWCGGLREGLDEETRYTEIGRIVNQLRDEKNKDIIYNVCRWQFPGQWVIEVADSWRVAGDIALNFHSILHQVDATKPLAKYHGPGHVNDLDMLQVGRGLSYEEDKTHFAMWCMMSTPLMLANDLRTISEETLSIVKNTELIAINQDEACLQANVVKTEQDIEIWVKDLGYEGSSCKAVALLNRGETEQEIQVNWQDLGFVGEVEVRDLWMHQDKGYCETYTVTIPPHSTGMYKVIGMLEKEYRKILLEEVLDDTAVKEQVIEYIPHNEAQNRLVQGAVLLDVRSNEEFEEGHLEGTINIPHIEVLREIANVVPDKDTEIMIYCTTRKRAIQTKNNLHYLGYTQISVLE